MIVFTKIINKVHSRVFNTRMETRKVTSGIKYHRDGCGYSQNFQHESCPRKIESSFSIHASISGILSINGIITVSFIVYN